MAVLVPAVLFAVIRGLPPRRAGWTGAAAFGAGLFAFGTYWLYTCIHVFGLAPIWLTLLLQAALVALMSIYPAVCASSRIASGSSPAPPGTGWCSPALWVLLEWLRGWALSGFPWLSIGYAMIDPLAGWAPLFGVYGVTWAAATMAVALTVLLAPAASIGTKDDGIGSHRRFIPWPCAREPSRVDSPGRSPIAVAAVQGAVSQDQKWQEKNRDQTMERYSKLTAQAWGSRLIVWPEASLPVLANEIPEYLKALKELGRVHDADFAIGLVNYDPAVKRYYNGLLVMSDLGGGWYYKRHLVPFGEYFPVPPFVRSWLRLMSLPYDDISPGAERQPMLSAAGQKLGLTICYEDAFGSSQLKVLRDATLLVNVTNNAWYGDSTAPHQHLQIARMRALEAGRYLIRAANDGITAAIGPRGEILARLPQFQEAVLHVQVQPMTGLTPYARLATIP